MENLKRIIAAVIMVIILGLASCSRGHHPGGNLTKNYHDEHLGSYKHHNR